MKRVIAFALLIAPAALAAQTRPPVRGALVKKPVPRSSIVAGDHTRISTAPSYSGVSCAGGCIVARGDNKRNVHVAIHPIDPAVKLEEVRVSLIVPHGTPHSVRLTLDEAQIVGLLCNGRDAMLASPRFRAMGAPHPGFKWAIFDGSKMVKSGHSNGESLKWNGDGKAMGPMQLAVFSDGTVEVTHGNQRVVMTSDDTALIEQRSASSLQYRDVSIWAADVPEFAIVSAAIQGVNR
jgi:hypothetical protein